MTAAAYRDQALADHRQLVHWIESRLGEENTTIHDAAKKSALEALTCFQRRPLDERVSMLETCFWEALERGFDGHSGQTLYAIDVLGLPGGSTTSGGVPWLPAGIHAYTVEAITGVALCQKPTRAVERPPRPLSLLNFWPNAGGINEPMAYLGSTLSRFGLHVEDMHLCSLSMLWSGEPKVWYVVPAAFAQDLERLLAEKWSATHPDANAYLEVPSASISKDTVSALTSKSLLISPSALARHQIPVYRTVQRPGQLVLTMPRAYHCGFNCGWNLAEAVNWAPIGWLAYCRSAIAWERRFLKPGTVNDLMLVLVQALLELNGGNVPSWPCRNLNLVRRLLLPCIRWSRALDEWVRIHHRNGNRAGRCTGNQPICWIRCSTACLEAAKELSRWQHKLKLCGQPCWWKRSHQRAWETVMHTLTHGKIFRLQNLALLHVDECLSLEHHWWRDAICVSTLFCSTCRAACGTTFSICLSCLQYRGRSIQGIRCEEHLRLVCDHEHSSDGAVDAAEGLASFRGARMIQSVTCEGSDCQNLNWEMHSLPLLIVSHIPPRNVMRRMLRRWDDYACLAKQNRALGDVCVSDLQSIANESSQPFESVELERIAFVPDRAFMSESRNLGNYRYLQGCAIIRGDGMEVSSIQESER
ncbi:hypothetical protein F1559_002578 [Cyanidiococcus yangmingshanensis]|uniref:JmjC domain-containing protein n=1 Tax=Cyanidiococcus yangmingshanensis TaxID=2690220 RepID=A0A7J7INM6_9RHOD|nr:hypothetical protein F1559_002578 [Cyanidiococcus yangmingshanensis]